ncbi:MAG: glutamine--fructose-6-phosphate transaminase (isomerizing) [Solirubrobacterales bacterium]|nr:glutamine--fructose-6-phosphate transaminase (isomerizing) [Solirubrobacterales bacterium]MBV9800717.1 glutamine--fructose-6-phosphate transaminase (isomerizing) [Solirubrobacterales bacterium]
MCGIIGYVGSRPCQRLLLEGLRRLEYRGYDSAGIAWREGEVTRCIRAVGNLDSLEAALVRTADGTYASATATQPLSAGIGHTRWATHGGVTERNAHPHADLSGRFRIVLNGIIENHLELRDRLAADLVTLRSDTDAEVVAHLIALYYSGSLADAVRRSLEDLEGHYALVAMCEDEPDTLVGVRRECPLVVGLGSGEQFVASSISAFLTHTREVAVLKDEEIAVMRPDVVEVFDVSGLPHRPVSTEVEWDDDRCEKDGFETFMLKEIHEQGAAVRETLSQWRGSVDREGSGVLAPDRLRDIKRIIVVACGTSYHAGLAGRNALEQWARIPVDVEVASEFRYREPIIENGTLVLGISQSGETADTLAAMRLAKTQGAAVVAVTNAPASQATRESDAVLFTRAGLEIGVAATKTFVAQVVLLYELALRIAGANGARSEATLSDLRSALEDLPAMIDRVVASVDEPVRGLAERLALSPFFLYLGRLSGLPVALEGALKLKEISYVPTDAYAAGEMKHGPIALLGRETPVVCVATDRRVLPKLLSNVSEVRARGAQVLAIASDGCKEIAEHAEHVIYIPSTDPLLQVVLAVVPLQLFAYHLARARGLNVDQPRNLAKTVTVE